MKRPVKAEKMDCYYIVPDPVIVNMQQEGLALRPKEVPSKKEQNPSASSARSSPQIPCEAIDLSVAKKHDRILNRSPICMREHESRFKLLRPDSEGSLLSLKHSRQEFSRRRRENLPSTWSLDRFPPSSKDQSPPLLLDSRESYHTQAGMINLNKVIHNTAEISRTAARPKMLLVPPNISETVTPGSFSPSALSPSQQRSPVATTNIDVGPKKPDFTRSPSSSVFYSNYDSAYGSSPDDIGGCSDQSANKVKIKCESSPSPPLDFSTFRWLSPGAAQFQPDANLTKSHSL